MRGEPRGVARAATQVALVTALWGAALPGLVLAEPVLVDEPPAPHAPASQPAPPALPSGAKPRTAPAATPRSAIDDLLDPGATPRRALNGFLRASEARDLDRAATFLDLRAIPQARRVREGAELGAMLHRVLTWSVVLDPTTLPDVPDPEGPSSVILDTLELDGETVPIVLDRVRAQSGAKSWKFSQRTVSRVRDLYEAEDRRAVEQRMPDALTGRTFWGLAPWQWIGLPVLVVGGWALGRLLDALLAPLLVRITRRIGPAWLAPGVTAASSPLRLAMAVAAFRALAPYLMLPAFATVAAARLETMLWTLAGGWIVVVLVRTGTRAATVLPEDTAGELEHRGMRTRLLMIERVATAAIAVLSMGVVLMQFEVVRTVGVSLLASAGVAGVVIGFAAQRTLGGVIGGIELAFTQPLRMGDTVVIDGENGTVEHMFFTYVIVRCWDGRSLIVPITRLLTQPFENWTRGTPEMLVQVEIHADYRVPVAAVRAAFLQMCTDHALWDGKLAKLAVISTTERTVQLRGLASVDNAAKSADLKHDLRERLLLFLQRLDGGAYLPRHRIESPANEGGGETAPAPPSKKAES